MDINKNQKKITLAVPKGRILEELSPLFSKIGIIPEADFFDENSRKLIFSSNIDFLEIVKVRSFDVATFVKYAGADLGICGLDVIKEFADEDFFTTLNLNIGKCRLSIAGSQNLVNNNWQSKSHLRIATKYPNISSKFFASQGIQTEIIKLNGAIEIASKLQLCDYIVDLVSSGRTLKENNMIEIIKIIDVSSHLIINKNSLKNFNYLINQIISLFDE
jgi:ATP phosphoribosyltransferase